MPDYTISKEHLIAQFRALNEGEYQDCGCGVSYRYFISERGSLLIELQGSDGWKDWVRNFWFKKEKDTINGMSYLCHGGFLGSWKFHLEKALSPKIKDGKINTIMIAGYSHGAALAGIVCAHARAMRPDLAKEGRVFAVCFEAPRFYAGGLIRGARKRLFAGVNVIRNGLDIVTHLPPRLFGFRHVGQLANINKSFLRPIKAHTPDGVLQSLEALPDGFELHLNGKPKKPKYIHKKKAERREE